MRASSTAVAPSGFFALRTPLLPWNTLTRLSAELASPHAPIEGGDLESSIEADGARLTERLRALVLDPAIREAIFVASPSLDEALDAWLAHPADARAHGVVDILVRYVARMSGRSTPFGLFSGCSLGMIGSATSLELTPRADYRRHTRLDTHYLSALTETLHQDPAVRAALSFRPSNGLYEAAGQFRFAEARTDAETRARSYHLVSIDRTPHLAATLERAALGALPRELVEALVAHDAEIDRGEAEDFVDSLIESQILVSELAPPITGSEPLAAIVEVLRASETAARPAAALDAAGRAIGDLDAAGLANAPARYREVAAALRGLPAEPDLSRLFQVDLYKPAPRATLGGEPLEEIEHAAALLARIVPRLESDGLKAFRTAFEERYGKQTESSRERRIVPLVQVLDEEAGIGFGESTDAAPLLDGLTFPADSAAPAVAFGPREEALLRGLGRTLRSGSCEWILDQRDLAELSSKNLAPLPEAFAVKCTLAARSDEALSRGEFRVVAPSVSGPSGAVLLGRFCHGDPALRRAVEEHFRAEEALRPDAVFAEIVHLPEGRLGNILCRPVLRPYEIPFLARAGVPADKQLPIGDLGVTLAEGRVVLWSRRLGREVVPRLTSAHNFAHESLGIYKFLCALQSQVERGASWTWGPLARAPFLPRVTSGRIVLSLARWMLGKDEIEPIATAKTCAERFRGVHTLRARRELPRWVAHVDFDNVLPVDLDNVLSVDSWLRLVKARDSVVLQEVLAEEELVARGPEGAFVHELVVPFVRVPAAPPRELTVKPPPRRTRERARRLPRSFPPGGEWLDARLYTGTASADAVLAEIVKPLVRAGRKAKALERWFFVRDGDPHWHVRVRFRGDPAWLAAKLLPKLHQHAARLLADGRIWRVELDSYEREVERYGGDGGIELAEDVFEADSEAVLSILERLEADNGEDARWRLALRGSHLLLVDLGLDLPERTDVVRRVRAFFGKEQRADTAFEVQLGRRFRGERASLEPLVTSAIADDHPLAPGFEALAARSERLRSVTAELRARDNALALTVPAAALAASFVHAHCNRLLHARQEAQELVLYDWLLRLYESQAARARAARR